jgi:VWFA-related protein
MRSSFRPLPAILQSYLALLALSRLAAQQPQQAPTPSASPEIKSYVNEVLVPVVVRDAQGHAVGSLKKENFQVLDDGKPQLITGFTLVKREGETPGANPSAAAPKSAPVVVQPPSSAQRFVIFLFDDLNLSGSDLMQAQEAAFKALDVCLRPSDTVGVLSTSGTNSGLMRDRPALQKAILSLKVNNLYRQDSRDCPNIAYYQGDLIVNKNDSIALHAATEDAMACAHLDRRMMDEAAQMALQAAQRAVAIGEQDSRTTLDFLRSLVGKMGTLPGQRVIILVSPGFLTPSTEAMSLKSQVLDMAAQGNVTISAIDARGLYATAPDASQRGAGSPGAIRLQAQYLQASRTSSESVMTELADGTGGSYFHNSNNLEAGLSDLFLGPEYLYLLAFSTANVKPNGAYHNLKVKVNQDGVILQARRGYFAPQPEKGKK